MTAPENNSHILWHDESCYFFSYVAYHRHQSGRKTVATCGHSRVCSVFLVRPSQEKKTQSWQKTYWAAQNSMRTCGPVLCNIVHITCNAVVEIWCFIFWQPFIDTQFVIAFCYKMNILSPILGVWQSPRNEVDTSESQINLSDTLREN